MTIQNYNIKFNRFFSSQKGYTKKILCPVTLSFINNLKTAYKKVEYNEEEGFVSIGGLLLFYYKQCQSTLDKNKLDRNLTFYKNNCVEVTSKSFHTCKEMYELSEEYKTSKFTTPDISIVSFFDELMESEEWGKFSKYLIHDKLP